MGTTDMGNFRAVRPAHKAPVPHKKPEPVKKPVIAAKSLRNPVSAGMARKKGQLELIPNIQQELIFEGMEEHRGFFEETGRNEHDGFDLDVPTYLRRGVRVVLN